MQVLKGHVMSDWWSSTLKVLYFKGCLASSRGLVAVAQYCSKLARVALWSEGKGYECSDHSQGFLHITDLFAIQEITFFIVHF